MADARLASISERDTYSIEEQDISFLSRLAVRDARHHLPLLRDIAAREHPDVLESDLGVQVDYTTVPPEFSVFLLDGHGLSRTAEPTATRWTEARLEAMVEKAQNNHGLTTLIEYIVCIGEGVRRVVGLTAQSLWEEDMTGLEVKGETIVDDVDIMVARQTHLVLIIDGTSGDNI